MITIVDWINTFSTHAAAGALESFLPGVVLAAIALLLLSRIRRLSSATRYGMLWVTLLAIVAVAVISFGRERPVRITRADVSIMPATDPLNPLVQPVAMDVSGNEPIPAAPAESICTGRDEGELAPSAAGRIDTPTPGQETSPEGILPVPQGRWTLYLALVWIAGLIWLTGRLLVQGRHLRRLKKGAEPLDRDQLPRRARHLLESSAIRPVTVAVSDEVNVPMLAGPLAPIILIPRHMWTRLDEEERDQVILHELGHLVRKDDWSNMAQQLIQGLLWFNPAVVWMGRHLALEREIACDDWVVAITGQRRAYAACLARLMELVLDRRRSLPVPGAVKKGKPMVRRIEMILNKRSRSFYSRQRIPLFVLLLGMAVTVLVYAGQGPMVTLINQPANLEMSPPDSEPAPATTLASSDTARSEAGLDADQAKTSEQKLKEKELKEKQLKEKKQKERQLKEKELKLKEKEAQRHYSEQRTAEERMQELKKKQQFVEQEIEAKMEREMATLQEELARQQEVLEKELNERLKGLDEEIAATTSRMAKLDPNDPEAQKARKELQEKITRLSRDVQREVKERIRPLRQEIREKTRRVTRENREVLRDAMRQIREEMRQLREEIRSLRQSDRKDEHPDVPAPPPPPAPEALNDAPAPPPPPDPPSMADMTAPPAPPAPAVLEKGHATPVPPVAPAPPALEKAHLPPAPPAPAKLEKAPLPPAPPPPPAKKAPAKKKTDDSRAGCGS